MTLVLEAQPATSVFGLLTQEPTNGSCVTVPKCRPCAYRKCNQTPTTRDRLNSTISPRWTASAKHSSRSRRTRPSTRKLKMTTQKVMLDQMRVSRQRRPPSRGSSTPSSCCSALPCYGLGEIPYLDNKSCTCANTSSFAGTCFSPLHPTSPTASDLIRGCSSTSSLQRFLCHVS